MGAIGGKTELLIACIKLTEIIDEKGYFTHKDVYNVFGFEDAYKAITEKKYVHVNMDGKWKTPC